MIRNLRRALALVLAAGLGVSAAACSGAGTDTARAADVSAPAANSSLFDAAASESAGAAQAAADAARDEAESALEDGAELVSVTEPDQVRTYELNYCSMTANEGDVVLDYPQISGWTVEDGDLAQAEERWNAFFRTQAENLLATQGEKDCCEIHYTVYSQDQWLLSLRGEGYFYPDGAAYPLSTCVTYNVFMQTGAAATLANTADLGVVADRLMSEDETVHIGTAGVTMEDVFDYQGVDGSDRAAVIELLADFDVSPEKTEYPAGYSYWDGDVLHLLFEIYHAAGDFVDVTLYS